MEAMKYIKKCHEICKEYENKVKCDDCPLFKYSCGLPRQDIKKCVSCVAEYVPKEYPLGKCEKCNYEFNSALVNEHQIKFCPNCGQAIQKHEI